MEKQPSISDQFLAIVNRIIEDHLDDEHFSVEDLAEEAGLSRSMLYRKLMKLTGKSPSDLIKDKRLDRAKELLEDNVATAAEIAYRVGFNSPSYFSSAFKKHYKVSPGHVRKSANANVYRLHYGNPADVNRIRIRRWWVYATIFLVFVLFTVGGKIFISKEKIFLLDKSIAVLPFRNDSPDPGTEYFCNGMMDEIITNLQKIKDIRVQSRTSTETYRNQEKTATQIARELEVAYILEGSVRKVGDDLILSVHLIDGNNGEDLWAENYGGKYTDEIFTFQSDIATRIASVLNAVITPEEKQKLATLPSVSVTAYDYILRAREEQWKYWFYKDTVAERNAAKLYDRALKLDPDYALGWAGKGSIYYDLKAHSEEYYEKNYLDSVLWYGEKISKIDPEYSSTYMGKALVYHRRGDIKNAIHNYEKVINNTSEITMVNCGALWRLGFIYIYNQDYQKGISLIREAVLAAKGSPRSYAELLFRLAYAYLWMGNYEEAENYYRQSRDMGAGFYGYPYLYFYHGDFQAALKCLMDFNPNPSKDWDLYLLGNIYFQLRDFENAVNYYRQYREFREARGLIQLDNLYREGIALIELGKKEEGKKLIEKQLSQLEKRKKLGRADGYDYHLATIAAYRGDQEKALQCLRDYEKKVFYPDHNIIPLYFAQYDALFKPLCNRPEFRLILKRARGEREIGRVQIREMEEG
jgi:TolB-like protein/AraC-like DNA-binding protein/Flp pilus assembly protein TadD